MSIETEKRRKHHLTISCLFNSSQLLTYMGMIYYMNSALHDLLSCHCKCNGERIHGLGGDSLGWKVAHMDMSFMFLLTKPG